jgi:putative SOS response-associated peptidase YedK
MCGRYGRSSSRERIAKHFSVKSSVPLFSPTYNPAPQSTQPVVMLSENESLEIRLMRWGLPLAWSKEPKVPYSTINASSKDIVKKPAYRQAFQK